MASHGDPFRAPGHSTFLQVAALRTRDPEIFRIFEFLMASQGPGRYLKSFLEAVRFICTHWEPVASHGDPFRTPGHCLIYPCVNRRLPARHPPGGYMRLRTLELFLWYQTRNSQGISRLVQGQFHLYQMNNSLGISNLVHIISLITYFQKPEKQVFRA